MKKRILSLSLLLAFLSFFAFSDIAPIAFTEKSSSTIEYLIEDRVAEKDVKISSDDNSASISDLLAFNSIQKTMLSSYIQHLYNFEFKNTLFRPPIFL